MRFKPGNISIQREPMAAILGDLGGAKLILPHVEDGTVGCLSLDMTTRWYAALEVLLRNEAYCCASDVWSRGSSITEMEMGEMRLSDACMISS